MDLIPRGAGHIVITVKTGIHKPKLDDPVPDMGSPSFSPPIKVREEKRGYVNISSLFH
jgi:hypothetical protein